MKKLNQKKGVVLTPIFYINGELHIGHLYTLFIGQYLSIARNYTLASGADEHGTKVSQSSKEAGVPLELFKNKMIQSHQGFISKHLSVNLSYRRTGAPEHANRVQRCVEKLWRKSKLFRKRYSGKYYSVEERFVKDCEYEKLLKDRISPTHFTDRTEDGYCYYPREKKDLLPIIKKVFQCSDSHIEKISNERWDPIFITRKSVDNMLTITIDSEEFGCYVWFEALLSYLEFEGVDMVHVLGKDIFKFHSYIYISLLLDLDVPLPEVMYTHGFIVDNNNLKISKSFGNFSSECTKYKSSTLETYLLSKSWEKDFLFSDTDVRSFWKRVINTFGNLVSRIMSIAIKLGEKIDIGKFVKDLYAPVTESLTSQERYEYIMASSEKFNKAINEGKLWLNDDRNLTPSIIYSVQLMLIDFSPLSLIVRAYINKHWKSEADLLKGPKVIDSKDKLFNYDQIF